MTLGGPARLGRPGRRRPSWSPTPTPVEALREVKDAGEVARMERAAAIADDALADVLPAA